MTTEQNRNNETPGAIRIIMPTGAEYLVKNALIVGIGVESDEPEFVAKNEAEAKARAERGPKEPCENCGKVHDDEDAETAIQILHGALSLSEVHHLRASAIEVTDQAIEQGISQLSADPLTGALFAALKMAGGGRPPHGIDLDEIFNSMR